MYKPGMVIRACNPSKQEVEEAGLKFKGRREAYVLMCFTVRSRQDRAGEQPETSNLLLLFFQENQSCIHSHKDGSDAFCSRMVG